VQLKQLRRSTLQKHNNSGKKSEPTAKRAKSRGPVQRDTKEVLAELVEKLKEKLDPKNAAGASAGVRNAGQRIAPAFKVQDSLRGPGEPFRECGPKAQTKLTNKTHKQNSIDTF
jgi:hypothetical protein